MEVRENSFSMSTNGSRSHLTIGNKGLTWWQRRTRLERQLVLILCFVSIATVVFLVAFVLHFTKNQTNADLTPNLCTTPDCLQSAKYIQECLDTTVDPCADFYQFSCGNWITIQANESNNVFAKLNEELFIKLRTKIEIPKQADEPKAIQDAKDVYDTCMNTANVDGKMHVMQWILEFGGWPLIKKPWNESNFNLEDTLAKLAKESRDYFIEVDIAPDDKNTSRRVIYVSFSVDSLDSEDILYSQNGSDAIEEYKTLIQNVTQTLSNGSVVINEEEINELVEFEIMLANISESEVESESLDFYYNKMTIAELTNITSHRFDWLRYFNKIFDDVKNITDNEIVIVTNPEQLTMFFRLQETVDKRVIANILMWKYWCDYSTHIGDSTSSQLLDLVAKTKNKLLNSLAPRWGYCMGIVDEIFFRATGNLLAKYYMKNETRSLVVDLISDLRVSLEVVLKENSWMDPETLRKAQEKMDAIIQFVGYPDEIFNETYVDKFLDKFVPSAVHVENVRAMLMNLTNSIILTIDEPVDRKQWDFSISTVDAFYDSSRNAIDIPAGIMMPPFFAAGTLKALNFGALGAVIGHELTHAFDNIRSQLDKYGNLVNWWTDASKEAYQLKADCLRQQYSTYCSDEIQTELNLTTNACVNGTQTLSENIADNGGLKIAFRAYESWVQKNGENGDLPGLTQFTTHQLFFISFAQVWCETRTASGTYYDLSHDEHSPNKFRVLGTLSNSEDFSVAFQCKNNSTMNPQNKCSFW